MKRKSEINRPDLTMVATLRLCGSVLQLLFLLLVIGCARAPALKLAPVSGAVTLDNQPLPEGVIVFTKEGEIPRELPISAGRFAGEAYVGRNHIQFAVYRKQAQKAATGPGADQPALENILPSRFSQESLEGRDVTADGLNQFDFALQSK